MPAATTGTGCCWISSATRAWRPCAAPPDSAYGRPGSEAWFVGPCVACGAAAAEALIGELCSRHGQEQIYWDLLPGNPAARKLAAKLGFRPVRRLWRMARAEWGPLPEFRPPAQIYAAAGFEFG